MQLLQVKIKKYLETHTFAELSQNSKVWISTIYAILSENNKRNIRNTTLIKLAKFFKIETKHFKKTEKVEFNMQLIGKIFRTKRLKKWFTLQEVTKKIKWSERHLARIEAGSGNFDIYSYYFMGLLKIYNFTKDEKYSIIFYILALQNLQKILTFS